LRCKWQYCFKGQFVNGKKIRYLAVFEKGKLVKETNMSFPENATKTENK
jgi:hypothetical protein